MNIASTEKQTQTKISLYDFFLKGKDAIGHRSVIIKRAVIGSKGGWKLSTKVKL